MTVKSNIQDKAKEAMTRAQEAMSTVQEAFEGESTASKLKGQARDAWKDTKVALGVDTPRWSVRHPYLLNFFIALFSLLLVVGAGYAVAKFARNRQIQKRVSWVSGNLAFYRVLSLDTTRPRPQLREIRSGSSRTTSTGTHTGMVDYWFDENCGFRI